LVARRASLRALALVSINGHTISRLACRADQPAVHLLFRICPYASRGTTGVPPGLPGLAHAHPSPHHPTGCRLSLTDRPLEIPRVQGLKRPLPLRTTNPRRCTATTNGHPTCAAGRRQTRGRELRAESEDPRGSNAPNGLCCARAEEIWGRSAAPQQTLDGNKLLWLPGRRARVLNWGSGGRRLRHPAVSVFYSRDGAPPRSRPETGDRAGAVGWHRDGAEIHPDSALSCSALLVSNPSFAWMELFEERVYL